MSGIRDYRREKKKNADSSNGEADDYKKKLRDHNLKKLLILVIVAILVVVALIIIVIQVKKHSYSGYSVVDTIRRTDSGYATYFGEEDIYIRCSRDGIAAFSYGGAQKWNKTYEINSLGVDSAGNYLAVADVGGNDIYFFDTNGFITKIGTTLPIVKISVSEKGLVVAILEDKDAS